MKIKNAKQIFEKLEEASNIQNLEGEVNYVIARNVKRLQPGIGSFNEAYDSLIKSFAEKDENGNPIVVNGSCKIVDVVKFNKKLAELLEEEIEFNPHTIQRSEQTDKLPASILIELLDVIILE